MKKINIKKAGLPIALVIVIVLSSVVAVWTMNQTDAKKLKDNNETSTTETTTLADGEPVTEVYTEIVEVVETSEKDNGEIVTVKSTEIETKVKVVNATEKKEEKATEKATEEKSTSAKVEKPTETQVDAPVAETTKNVVPTTQASKPVATTKPVETTKKPATTKPAKPTTTKANKDEYYPALTASDVEYLKKYAADYIKSKGYTHNPDLDWDNCGYSSKVGISPNISSYGDRFKVGVGVSPVEWAKKDIRDGVDGCIDDFGDTPWLEMTLLVSKTSYGGYQWAIGYMA